MKIALGLTILTVLTACGVKGRPLPPLNAPTIGRGKPTFSGRPERISLDELNKKTEDDDTDPNSPKRGSAEE